MIIKQRLLTPGPTQSPPGVAEALVRGCAMHHRSAEFRALFASVRERLGNFMLGEETRFDKAGASAPILLNGSGTLAMEAALVNLLNPGERGLFVVTGRFGARWAQLSDTLGFNTARLQKVWSADVSPDELRQAIHNANATGEVKAVFLPGCETSTGALLDVEALAKVVREFDDVLLCVDGITWLGAHVVHPARYGVDALTFGSQKALGVPPGLSALWLSERAWERVERVGTPRAYLDLVRERTSQAEGSMSFTAPIAQIAALDAALTWAKSLPGGYQALALNAASLSNAMRAGLAALKLEVLAERPAASLSVVMLDAFETLDAEVVRKLMLDRSGVRIAGGQEYLKGKALRFSHLGYTDQGEALLTLAAFEQALAELGAIPHDQLGASLAAFMKA